MATQNKLAGILNEIGATNRFRDPIYGYIWLSDDEVKIIDTPIFQRLRRIQQLALTKYVFPTAEHSRFVHSLGVLQCATNIFLELLRRHEDTILKVIDTTELLNLFKTLRFGALLHDIGHLPFSHACEKELLPDGLKHEHISQYIIENHSAIKEILAINDVAPKIVSSLLIGKPVTHKYNVIKKILSGVFDADRADYLLRDSYNCGVSYGNYDYIRYISSFTLEEADGKTFKLSIEYGNIQVLEAFLLARYHYNMQIPYHRTRTGIDRVLEEYVKYLKKDNRLPDLFQTDSEQSLKDVDLDLFIFFDEFELFQEIKKDYKNNNRLAKILLREDHLFPAIDRVGTNKDDLHYYADFIIKLENKGLKENEDFITYKKRGQKIHSLISSSEEGEEDTIRVKDKRGKDIGDIIECSPILKALEKQEIHLLRVYIFSDKKQKALNLLTEYDEHINRKKEKIR
jgi:HD superfamily phosphohydrolase